MARLNNRRSRVAESDDEGASRESTPISTAPNDRKRFRGSAEPEVTPSSSNVGPQVRNSLSRNGNTIPQPLSSLPQRRHQPGAILRVKLTNFVTYTAAEFFPGPNLNMVIGPNGTGKSTLVCAICLGLGWGPGLLGRAKDPAEFVKHGCREATIEIELQKSTGGRNKTDRNPIIMRTIKKDGNKSSFFINGHSATNKEVLDLVRGSFNIQVDNLCQFLPQDRVVEFAQMNPVQMLRTTLEAAADPTAVAFHDELVGLRNQQKILLSDNKGNRETLENLEKRQESQRNEVDRLKERQIIQKKLESLEKCRPILDFKVAKSRAHDLREIKTKLFKETAEMEAEAGPAMNKVKEKLKYATAAKENVKNHGLALKRADGECKRLERLIQNHEQEMVDCDQKHEAEKQSARKANQELGQRRQELNNLNASKTQEPEPFDSRAMNEEIQEHTARVRDLTQQGEELLREMREINSRGKENFAKKKGLEAKIESLNTQDGQRESRLETMSRDTFRAWQWIKNNQQIFHKEVLGPPAITCSIQDRRMVNAVEACLAQGDFKIITVQCREDFKILQDELIKKQRLHDVSIRTCSLDSLSGFTPPVSDDDLTKLGLEKWAIDCIQGPTTVLAMLCSEKFLHQTAIASNDVTQEQHEAIDKSTIKTYIAGSKSIRFTRRAEYGASTALVRDVRPAKVWTDQPVDAGRQQQLRDQVKQLHADLLESRDNKETLEGKGAELKAERDEEEAIIVRLKKEKDVKQKALMAWKGLDTKIEQTKNRIQQCEANIATVRQRCYAILQKKDAALFEKADAVLKYCEAAHALKEANAKLLEAEIIAIEAQSDSENFSQMHRSMEEQLKAKRKQLEEIEKEHNAARAEGKKILDRVHIVRDEAQALADNDNDHDLLDLMSHWADKDTTVEEYHGEVESFNAKLDLTTGGNQNTVKEFEERAKQIEKLQDKMAAFNEKQGEFIGAIRLVRAKLEAQLVPVISNINDAFSESFERIGCAGQVALFKASSSDPADCTEEQGGQENGLDFANWAIHISVKFRESEPLSLLDSHRQSGGERAVSTIFYLMALQSLSKSPFRVVDEINQGMDPRNERMVHGRMVDIASANEKAVAEGGTGGSQYFLITPKLLSGLKYEKGMTVLCIVSGENMPSAGDTKKTGENGEKYVQKGQKIDFAAFAARARELGMGLAATGTEGRRFDSGLGISGRGVRVGA